MSSQSSTGSGKSIFISYRRDDSSANTGRIYDRLIQHFDRESIFKDVDAIPIGVDFRKHLEQQVAGCKVLLAIIGPRWVGNDRLQDEGDFVRIEIEYGLDPDRDILVVPVLVGDSSMPSTDQLPDSLKDFAFRNAIHVRPDPDFHKDMDKLIKSLSSVVGENLAKPTSGPATAAPSHEPYVARGRKFNEPGELAEYFGENWVEGVNQFEEGYITDWVEQKLCDRGMASGLKSIARAGDLDQEQKFSLALVLMSDDFPLLWKKEVINGEWLAANPEKAIEICQSSVPQWYARYRPEDELNLLQTAGQIKKVVADKAFKGKLKNLAITLVLDSQTSLKWGNRKITTKWLAENPRKTLEICQSKLPELYNKCRPKDELGLMDIARRVRSVLQDKSLTGELQLSAVSMVVDPLQPVKMGADLITPQWLEANPDHAKAICSSNLPSLHKSVTGQDWLQQTAERVDAVFSIKKLKKTEQDASLRLALDSKAPLVWGGHKVTGNWLVSNPKKAAAFLESQMPKLVQKFKGDDSYIKLQQDRLKVLEAIKKIGVTVNKQKTDQLTILALADQEKFIVQLMGLRKNFSPSGPIAGAKDINVEELLEKKQPNIAEGVVLLACEESIFLSPEEKAAESKKQAEETAQLASEQRKKKSLEYVMDFGVKLDTALAKKLIEANDWKTLNTHRTEAYADPETAHLLDYLGNQRLKAAFAAQTPGYLDTVAWLSALPEIRKKEKNARWEHVKSFGVKNKSEAMRLIEARNWDTLNPLWVRHDPATPGLLDFIGNNQAGRGYPAGTRERLRQINASEEPDYDDVVALVCALKEAKKKRDQQIAGQTEVARKQIAKAKEKRKSGFLMLWAMCVFLGALFVSDKILSSFLGDFLVLNIIKWILVLSFAALFAGLTTFFLKDECSATIAQCMATPLAGLAFLYWGSWAWSEGWAPNWGIEDWSAFYILIRLVCLSVILLCVCAIFANIPGWIGIPVSLLAILALVYPQGLPWNFGTDETVRHLHGGDVSAKPEAKQTGLSKMVIEWKDPAPPVPEPFQLWIMRVPLPLGLELDSFLVKKNDQDGFTFTYVEGELRNTTTATFEDIKLVFRLFDAEDKIVDTATKDEKTIESGATWKFKAVADTMTDKAVRAELIEIKANRQ